MPIVALPQDAKLEAPRNFRAPRNIKDVGKRVCDLIETTNLIADNQQGKRNEEHSVMDLAPSQVERESNERAWKTRHGMGFRFKSRRPFYYPWEVVFIFGHQNASLLKRRERIVRAEQTGTCNQ